MTLLFEDCMKQKKAMKQMKKCIAEFSKNMAGGESDTDEEEDTAEEEEEEDEEEGIQGQNRHMHKEANEIMYIICTAVVVIWSALVKQFVCEVLGPSSRPKMAEGPSPSSSPMQLHMNKKNISCRCSHGACCSTFHAGVSAGPYMAISHVWLCSMCVCMVMHWCFTCCIVLP